MSEQAPIQSDLDIVLAILNRIMGHKSPMEWLETPNKVYDGQRPIDILNGADSEAKDRLISDLKAFDRSLEHRSG